MNNEYDKEILFNFPSLEYSQFYYKMLQNFCNIIALGMSSYGS